MDSCDGSDFLHSKVDLFYVLMLSIVKISFGNLEDRRDLAIRQLNLYGRHILADFLKCDRADLNVLNHAVKLCLCGPLKVDAVLVNVFTPLFESSADKMWSNEPTFVK